MRKVLIITCLLWVMLGLSMAVAVADTGGPPEPPPSETPIIITPEPIVTPEPTPVATPVVTPEPTIVPTFTPEPTVVPTPVPTPVVTPSPDIVVPPDADEVDIALDTILFIVLLILAFTNLWNVAILSRILDALRPEDDHEERHRWFWTSRHKH